MIFDSLPLWLAASFWVVITYYLIANLIYIILLFLSYIDIKRDMQWRPLLMQFVKRRKSFLSPGVTILVPAYNEDKSIVASVRSFLQQDYPDFDVIVVNDGSSDRTMEKLKEAFELEEEKISCVSGLFKTGILGTYRSRSQKNLFVIDKENGGKADSLNVGLSFSKKQLICSVDADSLLDRDALLKISLPFIEHPDETVAAGGTIRVVNGSKIEEATVIQPGIEVKPIILFQVVEYLRSFMCGRAGWNSLNCTMVISGAFGLFSRRAIADMGGYEKDTVGEDMELVLNLHEYHRLTNKEAYRIVFMPDPVCWTEVPSDWGTLRKQRTRWQRGLYESLRNFRRICFNPRMGSVGLVAYPYFLFIEFLSPVFEVFSYLLLAAAYFLGYLNLEILLIFFLIGIVYGMLITIIAILIEELYFSRYLRVREFLLLLMASFVEAFGVRQLLNFYRLWAIVEIFLGKKSWGKMERKGF